jgi:hypothetical protein
MKDNESFSKFIVNTILLIISVSVIYILFYYVFQAPKYIAAIGSFIFVQLLYIERYLQCIYEKLNSNK